MEITRAPSERPVRIHTYIHTHTHTHTYIQGDLKVSVHLMITIQKVTSNVQSFPRQFPDIYIYVYIDTRLTLTASVIPNSNYVIMVSDWNRLKYFCVFFVLSSSDAQRLFDHPVYTFVHTQNQILFGRPRTKHPLERYPRRSRSWDWTQLALLCHPQYSPAADRILATCSTEKCWSVYRQSRGAEPPFVRWLKYAATITSYLGIPHGTVSTICLT
jgi:hypothetical protein